MSTVNKKVKNATSLVVGDKSFKSLIEARIYRRLLELGITAAYEPEKIILQKGYKPALKWFIDGKFQNGKIRDLTYTPDFRFEYCGYTVYLEVKGFITDRYPLKRKMFLAHLESKNSDTIFAEVKTISGLNKTLDEIHRMSRQIEFD